MKAVYETPRVSFEAFAANNAVSVCAKTPTSFDCVYHGALEGDWDRRDEPENVIASVLGFTDCTNNAYFADWTWIDWDGNLHGEDTDPKDNVRGLSDNLFKNYKIEYGTKQPSGNFLGWLYISLSGDKKYDNSGWSVDKNHDLDFNYSASIEHAWLTPLYAILGKASPASY